MRSTSQSGGWLWRRGAQTDQRPSAGAGREDGVSVPNHPESASPVDLRLWPFWSADVRRRVLERIAAGDLAATDVDRYITRLEKLVRQRLAPGCHVLACGSGTAALASAYAALGLAPGAEVLVPTLTFRATVTPLLALGLRPVLCEADAATGGIDLEDAGLRVTGRTEALVVTHMWGRPVPLDAARALTDRHGLALVEDCSHAHGTRYWDQPVGSMADAAVWSLGTTKMATGGTCGVLATRDHALFERAVVFGQPKHRALAEQGVVPGRSEEHTSELQS